MEKSNNSLKSIILKCVWAILGTVLFCITVGLCYNYFGKAIKILVIVAIPLIVGLFSFGIITKKYKFYKLSILICYFGILLLGISALVIKSNIFANINSVDELVALIQGYGVAGKVVYVLIQFLQVTFIPIPSSIVTAAGSALYAPWETLLLSCIGLFLGSLFAFYLGRTFGVRLVKWVIGEDMLNKYNNFVKGKDKMMLIYMFIFPVFPDDMLCMIAGLTNMSYWEFIFIQLIARPLNVVCTVFLTDYMLMIPFRGWGLAVWALILLSFVGVFILMWKNSEKIEKGMLKLISKITGRPIIKNIDALYSEHSKEQVTEVTQDNPKVCEEIAATTVNTDIDADEEKIKRSQYENAMHTITTITSKNEKGITF